MHAGDVAGGLLGGFAGEDRFVLVVDKFKVEVFKVFEDGFGCGHGGGG